MSEDAVIDVEDEGGDQSKELQGPLKAEKINGIELPLEPIEGANPIENLILAW